MAQLGQRQRLVSQACAIEIATKLDLVELSLPRRLRRASHHVFNEVIEIAGADVLPIEMSHNETLSHVPMHHRDPFDRLIIAQALVENLTVVTLDRAFALYPGLDVYEI